jgi:hypothetical protein
LIQAFNYVRYTHDIVLLARTRWQLRRAIAALHEEIAALGLHLHRIKRFIGRTTQGFDFLGDQIRAGARLRPSAEGLRRVRARQLYEREGDWHRLRQYVLRWQRWHLGGLDGMVRRKGGVERTWHHVVTHLAGKHPPGYGLMGYKSTATTQRYAHLMRNTDRQAANRVATDISKALWQK